MQESDRLEFEQMLEQLKWQETRRRITLIKATSFVVSIAFFATVAIFLSFFVGKNEVLRAPLPMFGDSSSLRSDFVVLRSRIEKAEELIRVLSTPTPMASPSESQQKLATQLQSVDDRLKRIEAAILDSPERALSIPLLRKDLDEGSKRIEEYRTISRADFDRLDDRQTWILGGIGTVLLSVLGGGIALILKLLAKPGKEHA